MKKDAYSTEIGKLLLQTHKMKALDDFIAYGDNDYNINLKNSKVAVITGKNELERELPILPLPLKLDDTIIVDLRNNVRMKVGFENLSDIIVKRSDYLLHLYMVKLMDMAGDTLEYWRDTYVKLSQVLMTNNLRNMLSLDNDDKVILNGLVTLLAVTVFDNDKTLDTRIAIAQGLTIGEALSDTLYANLIEEVGDITSISDLVECLKNSTIVSRRLSSITETDIYSVISSTVFTTNASFVRTGIEYPPALLAIMAVYGSNSLYTKTKMKYAIASFSKGLKFEDRVKELDREMKDMLKEWD